MADLVYRHFVYWHKLSGEWRCNTSNPQVYFAINRYPKGFLMEMVTVPKGTIQPEVRSIILQNARTLDDCENVLRVRYSEVIVQCLPMKDTRKETQAALHSLRILREFGGQYFAETLCGWTYVTTTGQQYKNRYTIWANNPGARLKKDRHYEFAKVNNLTHVESLLLETGQVFLVGGVDWGYLPKQPRVDEKKWIIALKDRGQRDLSKYKYKGSRILYADLQVPVAAEGVDHESESVCAVGSDADAEPVS